MRASLSPVGYYVKLLSITSLFVLTGKICWAQTNSTHSSDSATWNRFSIGAGGFISSNSSGILLGVQQLGTGIQINLEEALGLETSTLVLRLNAKYRIGKNRRNSVVFGYFDVNRTAKKVLSEEIQIGDEVFPIGTEISSKFDLIIIRAKYGYSFFQDDRISMGGSFGFYIMPIRFSAKALNYNEQSTQFIAPLPLVGLYTDFKIKNKLYLKQSLEFLYLSVQNFSGRIMDLNIAVEHKTFDHFGLGFGVNINSLNISVTDSRNYFDFIGKINMQYSGLMLYGKYHF